MTEEREYKAIVLNEPYATKVQRRIKTIETRMRLLKDLCGDVVICCDSTKSKQSINAGFALCIVHVEKGRPMKDEDAEGACIDNIPGRYAYDLSNWRYFNYPFKFSKNKISGDFRGVFKIKLPAFIKVIKPPPAGV